jgi:hypothetical protein
MSADPLGTGLAVNVGMTCRGSINPSANLVRLAQHTDFLIVQSSIIYHGNAFITIFASLGSRNCKLSSKIYEAYNADKFSLWPV